MPEEKNRHQLAIAVVGGGVAGIVAAWLLQQRHRVTLFEKNDYVGGHTHTVVIPDGPDAGTPVDTGFIVFNDRTYPVLNRFFDRLGVAIAKSDMSFSYHCRKSGFQFASSDLAALFAQRRRLADPGHWGMLVQILFFNPLVLHLLKNNRLGGLTLRQFLRRYRFTRRFREHYLFPMVAAIWSAPDAEVDRFPMLTFARFFSNHGLLSIADQPQWYYVKGGSHTYVQAFLQRFGGEIVTGSPVSTIHRDPESVTLQTADGQAHRFDRVVIATHADEALALLADPTPEESRLLGPWRYSRNHTVLHTDIGWMPTNPRAWASWNVVRRADAGTAAPVTLTYHMNRLQQLNTHRPYLVTLNPFAPIAKDHVIAEMVYTHPVFTFDTLATQTRLPDLNASGNTVFCGSYFRYGFHEDAACSGLAAAAALGVDHDI